MEKPTAVFLDRDGTINKERGYITTRADLGLLAGAGEAIRKLNEAGIPVHVFTNQAGIARALYTEEDLADIHKCLRWMLAEEGAEVGSIYYCPHHPEGSVAEFSGKCDCRKPNPGMLKQASKEHGIDLAKSVVVGDIDRDIQAGKAVGAYTILVQTGHQKESELADKVVANLAEAVALILKD
ncbi:MAG: D-glycero-beta-D-manno-heptose 1,7-bisphosphate 7-phosphatase [Planctomycetota bacterium]|nr:D-glycero-beta-D-manno-heptose 1,7-bisphosphate 7-phosphatase [Planctomycetota bacterium]